MGSHVNRGGRRRNSGGGGGSGGQGGGGDNNDVDRKNPKYDLIDKKIDEAILSNNFESAGYYIVNKTNFSIPKNEIISFLLTSITIIQSPEKDKITNNEKYIHETLNNVSKITNYKFDKDKEDKIVNIINDNILKKYKKGGIT